MASAAKRPVVSEAGRKSFSEYLKNSSRILALCGAGLSQASGLPTFRGAGGVWRTHEAQDLATPEAFEADPGLVWQFYSYRRHMALKAKPNRAHLALAELARRREGFITLTQNVDGLSQRANHPPDQLKLLHGSLFEVKCSNFFCNHRETNFTDPIVPALDLPTDETDPTTNEARAKRELDISDERVALPEVTVDNLPQCQVCKNGLLRPGVVWFGEALPQDVLASIDAFIDSSDKIDLIMVIGTSSRVYPAAGYTEIARSKGARVAVFNMDPSDAGSLKKGDWLFQGDAAETVPELLKEIVGEIPPFDETSVA